MLHLLWQWDTLPAFADTPVFRRARPSAASQTLRGRVWKSEKKRHAAKDARIPPYYSTDRAFVNRL
jgi:hypothetical protein